MKHAVRWAQLAALLALVEALSLARTIIALPAWILAGAAECLFEHSNRRRQTNAAIRSVHKFIRPGPSD